VATTHGTRAAGDIKADIDQYQKLYPNLVDGIFLDEMSNELSMVAYYHDIYVYIKNDTPPSSYKCGPVIGNPGGQTDEAYLLPDTQAADILVTFEDTGDKYLNNYSAPAWVGNYTPEHFAHLIHSQPPPWNPIFLDLADARNAGMIYVTDDLCLFSDVLSMCTVNPWDALTSYWIEEVSAIEARAHRLTVSADSLFLNQRSNIRVQLVDSSADFNNVFGIQRPINQDLFRCQREVPIGFILDSGNRGPGELVFRLTTPEGFTYSTGPGCRNPDGQVHVRYQAISSNQVRIAWEDLFNLGDADFNDCIVDIVASEAAPPPPGKDVMGKFGQTMPGLKMTPRLFVSEKDTPGLANADRELVLSISLENTSSAPQTLVVCPMLHVHDPTRPDPGEPVTLQEVWITAAGGQRSTALLTHGGRSFRFPFPLPTPLTVSPNGQVLVNFSQKLSEFLPPGLENQTRAEIESKILRHQGEPAEGSSSLQVDLFFDFNLDPGDVFQCPHGANTTWTGGVDDPDDFKFDTLFFETITITNAFSTLTVPITTHTPETQKALFDGRPISAFIEVIPDCFVVECPSMPATNGTGGLPMVRWTTDPAPGEIFVIDELEKGGTMTLDFPSPVPEGAVVAFTVIMKEANSGRPLSTEAKRFAMDTQPPTIPTFAFIEDGMGKLVANATVLDEAASIQFVELLASRDGGQSFAGFPMDWTSGDFLNPTLFAATFGPLAPGKTLFKIRAVDEAGNASETPLQVVIVPIPGDLNGDGQVDCHDLAIVQASLGKRTGQPGFDPRADTNTDGIVNVKDLAFVTRKLPAGTRCNARHE
jgi:hypothetical protein